MIPRKTSPVVCYNVDDDEKCMAYSVECCSKDCQARIATPQGLKQLLSSLDEETLSRNAKQRHKRLIIALDSMLESEVNKDIMACWYAEQKKGKRGGGGDPGPKTSERKKDNRDLETKWTDTERQEIHDLTKQWEEDNNHKLPRLGYSSMSRSKVDSYTGEEIK